MMRQKRIWKSSILLVLCLVGIAVGSRTVQASERITIDENTFPDEAFRSYVSDVLDVNGDNSLSVGEQQIVTEMKIAATTYRCANLKGLEYFPNLTSLTYNSGTLTELDLSKNTELMELSCQYASFSTLDLSANTKLTKLDCCYSDITNLDLQCNTLLEDLRCSHSALTSINLSKNTELRIVYLTSATSLTALDLSNNKKLEVVSAVGSSIAGKLDVSNCELLESIYVSETCLEEIDASGCSKLETLQAQKSALTKINLSAATSLNWLVLDETGIETLDLSDNVELGFLSLEKMPLKQLALTNNVKVYSLYLEGTPLESIALNNHPKLQYIDVGSDGSTMSMVDLSGEKKNLKNVIIRGAESINLGDNNLITHLDLLDCKMTQLDVSELTSLRRLVVRNVPIQELDVSRNTSMKLLSVMGTQMKNIDVSNLDKLEELIIRNVSFTQLDIKENPLLTTLIVTGTQLETLDVSKQTALVKFTGNDNKFQSLDFSDCTKIETMDISNNPLIELVVGTQSNLKEMVLKYCSLSALDVSGVSNLQKLNMDFNYVYPKVSYSKKLYFADLPGFDPDKVSGLVGGTIGDDHILWTSEERMYYYYDVGNSNVGKKYILIYPEVDLELEDKPSTGSEKDDETSDDEGSNDENPNTGNGSETEEDENVNGGGNQPGNGEDSTETGDASSDEDVLDENAGGNGGTVGEDDSDGNEIEIQSINLVNTSVSAIATQQYCGMAIEPLITVAYNGETLKETQDYTVKYINNVDSGTAKTIIKGKGKYNGSKTITFTIEPFDVSGLSNVLKGKDGTIYKATYTKKAIKLATQFRISTLYKGEKIYMEPKNGVDYTLQYKNNKKIGTASIIYKFKGNYKGTVTKQFQIVPPTTKVASVKKSGSKLVVKWDKVSSCDRYEVYRATSKNGKYKKIATVKGKNKCTYADKKAKKGKRYYYKVKACKMVKKTLYKSNFSNAKKGKR